jgi:hypothetical protein
VKDEGILGYGWYKVGTRRARTNVEIAEVAHTDRALMSRARRFKSPHPDQLNLLKKIPRNPQGATSFLLAGTLEVQLIAREWGRAVKKLLISGPSLGIILR